MGNLQALLRIGQVQSCTGTDVALIYFIRRQALYISGEIIGKFHR